MPDFISLAALTLPLDRDGVWRLARLACLDLYDLDWRRSYLATEHLNQKDFWKQYLRD